MSFLVKLAYNEEGIPISESDPINDIMFYTPEQSYEEWEETIPENESSRIVSNEFCNIRHYMQGLSKTL